MTLEGLQPSQNYAISIVSVSQAGNSPPKQINEVTGAASTIPVNHAPWYAIGAGCILILVILGMFSLKRFDMKLMFVLTLFDVSNLFLISNFLISKVFLIFLLQICTCVIKE